MLQNISIGFLGCQQRKWLYLFLFDKYSYKKIKSTGKLIGVKYGCLFKNVCINWYIGYVSINLDFSGYNSYASYPSNTLVLPQYEFSLQECGKSILVPPLITMMPMDIPFGTLTISGPLTPFKGPIHPLSECHFSIINFTFLETSGSTMVAIKTH